MSVVLDQSPAHDVAVVNVKDFSPIHGQPGGGPPLTPVKWAHQTWRIYINVTVKNEGDVVESFNVTAYYGNATGNYTIGTQAVFNLPAGANTTLTFIWDVPDISEIVPYSPYALSAEAVLSGDVDPEDNILIGNSVTVMLYGDTDCDGFCTLDDLINFGAAWVACAKGLWYRYWPWSDFNGDGKIELDDLIDFGHAWVHGSFP